MSGETGGTSADASVYELKRRTSLLTSRRSPAEVLIKPGSALAHRKLVLMITLSLTGIFAAVSAAAAPTPEHVYRASLAYTQCMRAHGVPQPNPDHTGNIHLTPADEAALRKVGRKKVQTTDKRCFNLHLKGVVSTKPLSAYAQSQALVVLRDLKGCLKSYGFTVGKP